MKRVLLIGTSHTVQRGERSPEKFEQLISDLYSKYGFMGIAEEIDKGEEYLSESFCNQNNLKYLCLEPDEVERRKLGIQPRHLMVKDVIDEFEEEYPQIRSWELEKLPKQVRKKFQTLLDESYRARENEWWERLSAQNYWPMLCVCGAEHFEPFKCLLQKNGIEVTCVHGDWQP